MTTNPLVQRMREWRHDLHRHPELAFEEIRTSEFVADMLATLGCSVHRGLGRTGVVATLTGTEGGTAIGLRADMDALPMQELGDVAHRSTIDGRFHGCGHDGHVAMLLGAAAKLASGCRPKHDIRFIFQPAEEGAGGARAMIDDGLFERFPVEAVYGLHNLPGLAVGRFAIRAGPMLASFDSFDISVEGAGGHGAAPHLTADPVLTAAQIVVSLQSIVSRNVDPLANAVVSVTRMDAGSAYNVIPDRALLRGAVRTLSPSIRELVERRVAELADHVAKAYGASARTTYTHSYPVLVNDGPEAGIAAAVARTVAGADRVDADIPPLMGSEDFAFMLERMPGAYMLIGAGDGAGSCMVHDPRYDFNDAILPLGLAYWVALAMRERSG